MPINGENYRAWEIDEKDYPRRGPQKDQFKFLARYGILAANIHNTQPWNTRIEDWGLHIFPNMRYHLVAADPHLKNMAISLGCLTKNVEVAGSHFGFQPAVNINEDAENWSVRIELKPDSDSTTDNLAKLFPLIKKRYSNKRKYLPNSIPGSILADLKNGLEHNSTEILIVQERDLITQTGALQNQAISNQSQIEGFAKELADWLRLEDTDSFDGMPSFVAGIPKDQAEQFRKALIEVPGVLANLGKNDQMLIETSPVVGMILTDKGNLGSMINVGRTYQELALKAFLDNLSITPMQAIVEDQLTLNRLKEILNLESTPQMFFRMGYANNEPYHTPRRRIEESLI